MLLLWLPFLLSYLHGLEFEHQHALEPFNTLAKVQVNDLNKNPLELFYDFLCGYGNLKASITNLYNKRHSTGSFPDSGITKLNEVDYICKDIIKETYNNFCDLEGFKSNLIRHNKDMVQLWVLLQIPIDSHKRIIIKDGENAGRKLDHLRLEDIEKHLKMKYLDIKE